jgi:crotonobetainyl-CoA:carnitine CoA-transferase CaiB-like acyl-CoA transferase
MTEAASHGPLTGLRVLEIGHFVAAPFCTRLLADLGAEVIKVEPPAGDPVRQWGKQVNGSAPWWSLHARNKQCITLNLKHPQAASLVLRLVAKCDALVENFRPGQLDKLGLSEATLKNARPDLVIARISGYGQDGPYRERIPTAAPSNAYPTADDKWILIAGNSDPIFTRLAKLIGRPEIASDPRFIGNRARVQNVEQLDAMIAAWTKRFPGAEVDRMVSEADIPSCLLYTAVEIAADPQFRKRGMVREVNDPLFGQVLHAGVVPHVSDDPGTVRWPGARIGEHTEEVMRNLIGLKPAEIEKLRQEGVL